MGLGIKRIGVLWRNARSRVGLLDNLVIHSMGHTVGSEMAHRDVAENQIHTWFAEKHGKPGYTHRLINQSDYLADAAAALDGYAGDAEIAPKSEKRRMAVQRPFPETLALRDSCLTTVNASGPKTCVTSGAGEAIRTPDPNLGKVVLYP